MASYHLSVKTIKRSVGRTATAAAAYRAGERIECEREGRLHDYTAKRGVEETFIITPEHAPAWARDRAALWNAAEASETRRNSVTAREWELALPSEISPEDRSRITRVFAEELVSRYGVAVDVAIHAPHREGDQRNHHAHVLTTTRRLEAEGFTTKTRVLDAAKTGGAEIELMRGVWAELQNGALERAGEDERVDHRSLEAQRETALNQGDTLKAEELDRDPELKLGPAANSMERREKGAAEREGREYVPVTERGAIVHAARQARAVFQDMRERLNVAREAYVLEREQETSRVSAAVKAAKTMFTSPATDDFAAGFSEAWQAQEDVRLQALEEELERERLLQLEVERVAFVENTAQAWEESRQITDPELAKTQQDALRLEAKDAADRYGVSFADLAESVSTRANEIRDTRKEQERQKELELEKKAERAKDSGREHGM